MPSTSELRTHVFLGPDPRKIEILGPGPKKVKNPGPSPTRARLDLGPMFFSPISSTLCAHGHIEITV